MGKYEPLGQFLRKQSGDMISMTFKQVEKIIGSKLPSSKESRTFWSNNPRNNVMTKEWLEAGYETELVDVVSGKLQFRRKTSGHPGRLPNWGSLKGLISLEPGFDPTAPLELEPDWDAKYRTFPGSRDTGSRKK